MNKSTLKIFLVVGLLVLIFVAWQVIFNDGGVLQTAFNAMVDTINNIFKKVTGGTTDLLPKFGATGAASQGETLTESTGGF